MALERNRFRQNIQIRWENSNFMGTLLSKVVTYCIGRSRRRQCDSLLMEKFRKSFWNIFDNSCLLEYFPKLNLNVYFRRHVVLCDMFPSLVNLILQRLKAIIET